MCVFEKKKVKVKVTLVQALRLCTGRTAHGASRGTALPFHDHGTRREWVVSVTHRPLFIPGKETVTIVQEAGWAPGPVWTGAENLDPTGIRSPDRTARSQSLYLLSYRAHCEFDSSFKISTPCSLSLDHGRPSFSGRGPQLEGWFVDFTCTTYNKWHI